MQKVAKEQGIKWVQFENQGNPTQWATGMNQAISQKADLIILRRRHRPEAAHPAAASGPRRRRIKVLVNHLYQNGEAPDQQILDLIDGYITVPFHESGELSVEYAVADGGCDAVKSTLIINAKEVPPSQGIVDAMTDQARRALPRREAEGRQRAGRRLGHEDRA